MSRVKEIYENAWNWKVLRPERSAVSELFHSTPDQMIMNLEEQAGGQFVFPVNNVTFFLSLV